MRATLRYPVWFMCKESRPNQVHHNWFVQNSTSKSTQKILQKSTSKKVQSSIPAIVSFFLAFFFLFASKPLCVAHSCLAIIACLVQNVHGFNFMLRVISIVPGQQTLFVTWKTACRVAKCLQSADIGRDTKVREDLVHDEKVSWFPGGMASFIPCGLQLLVAMFSCYTFVCLPWILLQRTDKNIKRWRAEVLYMYVWTKWERSGNLIMHFTQHAHTKLTNACTPWAARQKSENSRTSTPYRRTEAEMEVRLKLVYDIHVSLPHYLI